MTDDELVELFRKDNCFKYPQPPKGEKPLIAGCLPGVAKPIIDGLVDDLEVFLQAVLFTKYYNDCLIRVGLPKWINIKQYEWHLFPDCKIYKKTTPNDYNSLYLDIYVIVCSPNDPNVFNRMRRYLQLYTDFLSNALSKRIFV